jgi:NADH:ubiquinone oxidoreductase subunit 3 (subunit A)
LRKSKKNLKFILGNYLFMFFFFSSFFIVYLWSLGAKFSLIFFWNGVRFVFREDFFRNYNFFSSNGEIYECGFSGVEEPLKKIEVQYLILSIFFIIYEIEFLILLPFFLNLEIISFITFWTIISSFFLILFSYWYEWEYYLLHFTS